MFSQDTVLRLTVLIAMVVAAASAETRISYPSFSPRADIMALGDSTYDPGNRSYIINTDARTISSRGSCGALLYGKPVRLQDVATGRVASFRTSFSFRFATFGVPWDNRSNPTNGSGFSFSFLRNTPTAATTMLAFLPPLGESGACRRYRSDGEAPVCVTFSGFAVYLDTDYDVNGQEPSNNFLGVTKFVDNDFAHDRKGYTHNFCGNATHCEYFSNGRVFTMWIEFSLTQTLEVWIANGTDPKPRQPVLRISECNFPKSMGDEVYLMFWGSSDVNHLEEHELLSWSFFSSDIPESTVQILLRHLRSRTWLEITAGVVFGTVAAFVALWIASLFAKPSCTHAAFGYCTGARVFSYKELRSATHNFDERNLLGHGGSGNVYKGSLKGGEIMIAVKQINVSESKQAQSLFHNEVTSLGQIRHRNVVRLRGWCQEKGKLLLVYDFMSNGNLNDWLHTSRRQHSLSLQVRQSILEGVGAALEYLHEDFLSCVLHRDIKSSNVLLDEDFNAYVGDFGLARLMDHPKLDKTTIAAGTFGYMAPELPYTGKATKKSDVYSFGILVLEVMCGKIPLDLHALESEGTILLHTVWRSYENGSLLSMVDPRVIETIQPSRKSIVLFDQAQRSRQNSSQLPMAYDLKYSDAPRPLMSYPNIEAKKAMAISLLQLGLLCCLPNPKSRPSMGEVNRILRQIHNMGDELSIKTLLLQLLPATKPQGLNHSFELSHRTKTSSSSSHFQATRAQSFN